MKVAIDVMIILSTGYNHVRRCHKPVQKSTLAEKIGQEISSKTKEPAIWPANVDVRKTVKKADNSFEFLLWFRMFFEAMDCRGEIKTRKPVI
jgi:hypothetical protein